ncbi:hypothetical protein KR093_003919 [Drosophila rubida]|uniref:Uncharacterized protein n=1 Tax=Drosophila rubida TaxID=30044 RepID=A0AAD4KA67_9MUSC|nr:hypothetical protein KR093_003919 [Drosophila rubida]
MSGRRTKNQKTTWMLNSHSFFAQVIEDTFKEILDNSELKQFDDADKLALGNLHKLWMDKYKVGDRQPISNCDEGPQKPKRQRKGTAAPCKEFIQLDEYTDAMTLDDDCDVIYRICIPPLRSHWKCRAIDLKVKARICKNNLLEPLINWNLLDSIMELPLAEATSLLQSHVDEMLNSDSE